MSRGLGWVMSAILRSLTDEWQDVDSLARQAYDLKDSASITEAQIAATRRAMHQVAHHGWAEVSLRPLAGTRTGRGGQPPWPRYLHARRTDAGWRQQGKIIKDQIAARLRQEARAGWETARRQQGQPPAAAGAASIGWDLDVPRAASLIGNLQDFEELHRAEAITEIPDLAAGGKINLSDVQALYALRHLLSWRDSVLIEVALYHDQDPANPRLQDALRRLLQVSRAAGNPHKVAVMHRPSRCAAT